MPSMLARSLSAWRVARRRPQPGPITIGGLLSSTVGIGKGARNWLTALDEIGYPVDCYDFGNVFQWHKNIAFHCQKSVEAGEGGVILIHLNPPELALALPFLHRKYIEHKTIVGYWAWEIESIPEHWKIGFHLVDQIWVPSRFIAAALKQHTNTPVHVVHHPVPIPKCSSLRREDFQLAAEDFVVLCMFDMRSSAARKNPFDAVRAFQKAFNDRSDVTLVIKISSAGEAPGIVAQLKTQAEVTKNIMFMFDRLEDQDVAALIRCADVVFSLHRAEGFGLVLAEAMMLGKPVVATAYSGNMDFMSHQSAALIDYQLVPVQDPQNIYSIDGVHWAEPDIEQAAAWLRRLEADKTLRKDLGSHASTAARSFFSLESFAKEVEPLLAHSAATP